MHGVSDRDPRDLAYPLYPGRTQLKRKKLFSRSWHFDLGLPASRAMRDKRLLFGNPPVCGVVQPLLGQTETVRKFTESTWSSSGEMRSLYPNCLCPDCSFFAFIAGHLRGFVGKTSVHLFIKHRMFLVDRCVGGRNTKT